MDAAGHTRPSSGLITRCEFAQGPGIRIDTQAYKANEAQIQQAQDQKSGKTQALDRL